MLGDFTYCNPTKLYFGKHALDGLNEELPKYGKRVMVVGLKCFHLWRTEKGIELVGPRYFGVDTDYIPLEERCKGGN